MLESATLAAFQNWRETVKKTPQATLISELQRHPHPVAQARLAELINRMGNHDRALAVLQAAPLSSLLHGVRALAMLDQACRAPLAERAGLMRAVADLPEDLGLRDDTYAEAQSMTDFARGQAFGELGLITEARRLLFMARRGATLLGIPLEPIECAIERLDTGDQTEAQVSRLRQAIKKDNPNLTAALADDVVRSASKTLDLPTIREALVYMRDSDEKTAITRSVNLLEGRRLGEDQGPDGSHSPLAIAKLAAYLHQVDQAVAAEQKLDFEQAKKLALKILPTAPLLYDPLGLQFVMALNARLLLITGDVAEAASTLGGVNHPSLHFAAALLRAEIAIRIGDPLNTNLLRDLGEAAQAFRLIPEPGKDLSLLNARRISTNAYYLFAHLMEIGEKHPTPMIGGHLKEPNAKALLVHRAEMERNPHRFVAFEWYVALLLPLLARVQNALATQEN